MLPSFMTSQIFTRKRFPRINDHGTSVVDYAGTPSEVEFTGSIQPGTGTTDTVNRDGAEVVKTIFTTPSADVEHYDQIDIAGKTYWVNGEPDDWNVGILDHKVIQLSRWMG